MIDVELHFKRNGHKRLRLPTVPPPGAYVCDDGRLWRVDCVVFAMPSTTWGKGIIDVYALAVADDRMNELEQLWATWTQKN